MVSNNQMYCLGIKDLNSDKCPGYTLEIEKGSNGDVQCIYGTGFNDGKDGNSFGFVVINNCEMDIDVKLELDTIGKRTKVVYLNKYVYNYDQYGDGAKYTDCINDKKEVWECGPVKPQTSQENIETNQDSITLNVKGFTLVLGDADASK